MNDAVAWIADGSALLELVPPSWVVDVRHEHDKLLSEFRREARYTRQHQMEAGVQAGASASFKDMTSSGVPLILWTNGVIGYHVDIEFPAFTVLLILDDAGLTVCGKETVQPAQRRGQLIGLHAHKEHALVEPCESLSEMLKRGDGNNWYDEPPLTPWIALSCDFARRTSPERALDKIGSALRLSENVRRAMREEIAA